MSVCGCLSLLGETFALRFRVVFTLSVSRSFQILKSNANAMQYEMCATLQRKLGRSKKIELRGCFHH